VGRPEENHAMAEKKAPVKKTVESIKHDDTRKNISTAEYQSVMKEEQQSPACESLGHNYLYIWTPGGSYAL
jgi:hypothetical protein